MSSFWTALALTASAAHAWTIPSLHLPSIQSRTTHIRLQLQPDEEPAIFVPAAATGEDVEKTDGIPNYMIRNVGTVTRVAESPDSESEMQADGVHYEMDRVVSIVTSDVIDMVQQQGGAAEKVDYLGENLLVEGMLFDDFMAEDTFAIAPEDAADDGVFLEIVEARPTSELELGQLGDDEAQKQSISSFLSMANGFSGWTAKVVTPGQVGVGYKIAKQNVKESDAKPEPPAVEEAIKDVNESLAGKKEVA